jgi:hypothetical protein
MDALTETLPDFVDAVASENRFAEPRVTVVRWEAGKAHGRKDKNAPDENAQD